MIDNAPPAESGKLGLRGGGKGGGGRESKLCAAVMEKLKQPVVCVLQ